MEPRQATVCPWRKGVLNVGAMQFDRFPILRSPGVPAPASLSAAGRAHVQKGDESVPMFSGLRWAKPALAHRSAPRTREPAP